MISIPHKCTRCEKVFKDGAAEILSGCPACGWNKFLYVKEKPQEPAPTPKAEPKEEPVAAEEEEKEGEGMLPHERFIREVDELREGADREDRVESVRILGPGSYELDLEGLLERKEIVMSLKEDGTYVVHLPSVFGEHGKQKKK